MIVVAVGGCRSPRHIAEQQQEQYRAALLDELQTVSLKNCEFDRIGGANDGGYLSCKNLVGDAQAFYSYGIEGRDGWGCTLSARHQRPVHQYDCFDVTRPPCEGASPFFHEECVGPTREVNDGRPYDTVEAQLQGNGDAGKPIVMKMDVEGSEWPSFISMPDSVLRQIVQLSVEFHELDDPTYRDVIVKLKKHFHVVNVHYNNNSCMPAASPHPSQVFEVLFVNKNVGVVDEGVTPVRPNPLETPSDPASPDCQLPATQVATPGLPGRQGY
jgi:hypothetical protein